MPRPTRLAAAALCGLLVTYALRPGEARPAPEPSLDTPVLGVSWNSVAGQPFVYNLSAAVTMSNVPDDCAGSGLVVTFQREVGAIASEKWEDFEGVELTSSQVGPVVTLKTGQVVVPALEKGRRYRVKATGFYQTGVKAKRRPVEMGSASFSDPYTHPGV